MLPEGREQLIFSNITIPKLQKVKAFGFRVMVMKWPLNLSPSANAFSSHWKDKFLNFYKVNILPCSSKWP